MSFPSMVEKLHESGALTSADMEKLSSLKEEMLIKLGSGLPAFSEFVKNELAEGGEMDERTFNKIADAIEAFEKTAGAKDTLQNVVTGLTAATLLSFPVINAAQWIARRQKLKSTFNSIMTKNPELKSDPNVEAHWHVLTDYAPDIAVNPTVAGTLLRRMKNWGEVDHQTVKDLIGMQKSLNEGSLARFGGPMDASKGLSSLGQSIGKANFGDID